MTELTVLAFDTVALAYLAIGAVTLAALWVAKRLECRQ